ncbi:MAG: alcohol dehydrogenase catalytic domain-containing protein [Anaerolineae bacterium]|nr:alcohol dehydrogenase catalytic domain-containing protein [Anaerolineae bacterium]
MQALQLTGTGLRYTTDYPQPQCLPGDALIRVRVAGICSTDLEIVKGYAGFTGVLGHEFVGEVVEANDATWLGKRVVGTINISAECNGTCGRRCPEHCPDRTVLGIIGKDGVFADFVTLPLANLLPVPDTIPDEVAVFTEPLAAAIRITEQVPIAQKIPVAVVGPGRLGMLVAQVLQQAGADVTVIGRRAVSLELAAQLGMKIGFADDFAGETFALAVEATGNAAGLAQTLRLVVPQGTVVLKSTYAANPTVDLTPVVVNELNIIGSRCGPFAPALDLLASGKVVTEPFIEGRYALSDGIAAFAHAAQPGVRKILLYPDLH